MEKLIITHKIGKSTYLYGLTIPQNDYNRNKEIIEKAYENKVPITLIVDGKAYSANIDHGNRRDGLFRLMFKSNFKTMFQTKYRDCYDEYVTSDGKNDYKLKEGVVKHIGFYLTDKEYVWEMREIEGQTVSAEEMKKAYSAYLKGQKGKFNGYVKAIDKDFVRETVKKQYSLSSAYCITSSTTIDELVNIIRTDHSLNQKDKDASSRAPSCSLKKYSEFLKSYNKNNAIMPFEIHHVIDTISQTGLIFDNKFVERYLCSLLTKPFVILSGLTGSGKTRLAMAFPKMICEDKSQYKLIPVGADWTNREQLLGYPNALRPGEYVMPDNGVLQLILEASKPENAQKPFFLVLDEMNMSYVERYFADFLSAMESGEAIPLWEGNGKVPGTITLPKNLFIIGTINVDETTYMFSPKVLDRANVIEFRINREQMLEYLNGTGTITMMEKCSEYAADFVTIAAGEHAGALSDAMKKTLIDMFDILGKIQKEFGYRTAHEMSRYITITKCYTDMSDDEAIDSAMVQKLLPKIHGSRKKIAPVLKTLWNICFKHEAIEIDTFEELPISDTFRYPLTAEKIWRMYQIAQDNGFTSFAEA